MKRSKIFIPNSIKIILIFSLGFNILAAFYIGRKIYHKYYHSNQNVQNLVKRKKLKYFINRHEQFENLPKDKNSIVFLGTSLTSNFELAETFQNIHIKNRGINSEQILGIIDRLQPIFDLQPKKIFIEIGINELGNGVPKEEILSNYYQLLDTLKKECDSTQIYIQSIFPVENRLDTYTSFCNAKVNKEIIEINKELKVYAAKNNMTFIDTHTKFVKNGQLNPNYSADGVHLSGKGYLLWTEILRPYLDDAN